MKERKKRFEQVQDSALDLDKAGRTEAPEQTILIIASERLAEAGHATGPLKGLFYNLPVQLTPLIGREQEVALACALLQRPDMRLLTLTGMGGIGKTRLGLQIATELLDDFADGICFVPLAPIMDSTLVVTTIARALGLREAGDQPFFEYLKA